MWDQLLNQVRGEVLLVWVVILIQEVVDQVVAQDCLVDDPSLIPVHWLLVSLEQCICVLAEPAL